jgi:hypothetical protein
MPCLHHQPRPQQALPAGRLVRRAPGPKRAPDHHHTTASGDAVHGSLRARPAREVSLPQRCGGQAGKSDQDRGKSRRGARVRLRPNGGNVRIAVVFGLVARQRYQPRLGFRRDRWFLTRPRSIVEGRKRPMGQRPLDAPLNRLMVHPNRTPDREERRAVSKQHPRPRHPAPSFRSRSGNRRQLGGCPRHSMPIRPPVAIHPSQQSSFVSPNEESANKLIVP